MTTASLPKVESAPDTALLLVEVFDSLLASVPDLAVLAASGTGVLGHQARRQLAGPQSTVDEMHWQTLCDTWLLNRLKTAWLHEGGRGPWPTAADVDAYQSSAAKVSGSVTVVQ